MHKCINQVFSLPSPASVFENCTVLKPRTLGQLLLHSLSFLIHARANIGVCIKDSTAGAKHDLFQHWWLLSHGAVILCSLLSLQIYCAFITYLVLNERLSLFIARFEYPPKWCTYSALWFLHGWCHVRLLPFRGVLCAPYDHAPCHVTSCKATYIGCMPPALLA